MSYVLALVTVVVGVDASFFRHRFLERLTVNVGVVLVFAAFYLRFAEASVTATPPMNADNDNAARKGLCG